MRSDLKWRFNLKSLETGYETFHHVDVVCMFNFKVVVIAAFQPFFEALDSDEKFELFYIVLQRAQGQTESFGRLS